MDVNSTDEKSPESLTQKPDTNLSPRDETSELTDDSVDNPDPELVEPDFILDYRNRMTDINQAFTEMSNKADWRDRDEIIRLLKIEASQVGRQEEAEIKMACDMSQEAFIDHIQQVFDAVIAPVFRAVARLHAYRNDVFDHYLGKNLEGVVMRLKSLLESIGFVPDAPVILREFDSKIFDQVHLTDHPTLCELTCYKENFGEPSEKGTIVDIKAWGYKINKGTNRKTVVYIKHAV
ncbi:MAG: hypothetical protein ACRER2_10200 [Methylococcales bacterium]